MKPSVDKSVFVTGLWKSVYGKRAWDRVIAHFERALDVFQGRRLIAFYEDDDVLTHIRQLSFQNDVSLIAIPQKLENLPNEKHIPEFLSRTRSYGVAQEMNFDGRDILDKSWFLYNFQYLKNGEEVYTNYLRLCLGRIYLAGDLAPKNSSFQSQIFRWFDPDFMRWDIHDNIADWINVQPHEFEFFAPESFYNYLGVPLPMATYFMSANLLSWQRVSELFQDSLERLSHLPYCYDDEVILALAIAQKKEAFGMIPNYEFSGDSVSIDMRQKAQGA